MDTQSIFSLLLMALLASVATMAVFASLRRREEGSLSGLVSGPARYRFLQRLIVGTDADLKVEAAFFAYQLILLFILAPAHRWVPGDSSFAVLCAVAVIQGFHLRQWFSKWRFRNIIYFKILTADRRLYTRGLEELSALAVNNLLMAWLIYTGPVYVVPQIAGFLLHEVTTEIRKRRRLLRRKLHLFDLNFIDEPAVKSAVIDAVDKLRLTRIERLADRVTSPRLRVLLHAFGAWIQNDFDKFRELFTTHRQFIEQEAEMCFYFGKSFYALGDVSTARDLLSIGWSRFHSRICLAYYSLCELATDRNIDNLRAVEESLRQNIAEGTVGETPPDMYACAYYALSIAIGTTKNAVPPSRVRDGFFHIHEAMRINQRIRERSDLGRLADEYFQANNQEFLDIYGYLVYRQHNSQLSFAILESAIKSDDTYPWPYFHVALIYEAIGRSPVARAIYYRIAVNEISDTVLKRLCLRRLHRLSAPKGDVLPT